MVFQWQTSLSDIEGSFLSGNFAMICYTFYLCITMVQRMTFGCTMFIWGYSFLTWYCESIVGCKSFSTCRFQTKAVVKSLVSNSLFSVALLFILATNQKLLYNIYNVL